MKYILTLLLYSIGMAGLLQAQETDSTKQSLLEITGYVKQMQSVSIATTPYTTAVDGLIHNRLNFQFFPNNKHFRINSSVRTRVFYGQTITNNPSFETSIEQGNQLYFDLSHNWLSQENVLINTNIDRLYTEITLNKLEFTIGRQRINWGFTSLWNPNDLFNNYDYTDFDYEERQGVDAIKATVYTGAVSKLEAVLEINEDWSSTTAAILYRWNAGSFDLQMLTGKYRDQWTIGGGWSGYLGNLGWKGEANTFVNWPERNEKLLNLSTEFNYYFNNGLLTQLGYLYTESGVNHAGQGQLLGYNINPIQLFPFRHSLWTGFQYSFTPLLSAQSSLIWSPLDFDQFFISNQINYQLARDWDLDFVSQLYLQSDHPIILNNNNFGYYLRIKYNL
ncbi:hypothetical protein [Membranihabitans marinus]|uniref:hypothetical protein n=1 Tax=Membranihabitans marinus TaxID=1227546 RepID=UPI001F36FB05|nr:hypothetical protein [Membranihabitans marinus]